MADISYSLLFIDLNYAQLWCAPAANNIIRIVIRIPNTFFTVCPPVFQGSALPLVKAGKLSANKSTTE